MTAMADIIWDIKIRNLAADEDKLVASLGPRQILELGLPLDLMSEFGNVYQVTATISPRDTSVDPEARAKERQDLDKLSDEAGKKIRKWLKDKGDV